MELQREGGRALDPLFLSPESDFINSKVIPSVWFPTVVRIFQFPLRKVMEKDSSFSPKKEKCVNKEQFSRDLPPRTSFSRTQYWGKWQMETWKDEEERDGDRPLALAWEGGGGEESFGETNPFVISRKTEKQYRSDAERMSSVFEKHAVWKIKHAVKACTY